MDLCFSFITGYKWSYLASTFMMRWHGIEHNRMKWLWFVSRYNLKCWLVYRYGLMNQWIEWDSRNVSFITAFSSIEYTGLGRCINLLCRLRSWDLRKQVTMTSFVEVIKTNTVNINIYTINASYCWYYCSISIWNYSREFVMQRFKTVLLQSCFLMLEISSFLPSSLCPFITTPHPHPQKKIRIGVALLTLPADRRYTRFFFHLWPGYFC